MTFTEDEGNRVAVNNCAAWGFSTSLMASAHALWSLLIPLLPECVHSSALYEYLIVAASLLNLHLLAFLLNQCI